MAVTVPKDACHGALCRTFRSLSFLLGTVRVRLVIMKQERRRDSEEPGDCEEAEN